MLNQLPKELLLEQVNNGLILLLLGMGVVFLFLTLLVFSTKFLSFFVKKYFPEKVPVVAKRPVSASGFPAVDSAGAEIAVAVAAAVEQSKR
ncbi:MAG: OadG family protein [Sphaerochaetaceae bacterium]|jgi:oxaloacetate decarboxylase gamma subunit|nr:OadG family protein [Sphaerochaetaceae bacterium]MDD4219652.1 OadG family protein [Sphaerochaetaceae bacterium]MDY0371351.1 OadG family protein [Sphaerochaetaceae bacterium]